MEGGWVEGPCCASISLISFKCHILEELTKATGRDPLGYSREFKVRKVTLESDPGGPAVPGWGIFPWMGFGLSSFLKLKWVNSVLLTLVFI